MAVKAAKGAPAPKAKAKPSPKPKAKPKAKPKPKSKAKPKAKSDLNRPNLDTWSKARDPDENGEKKPPKNSQNKTPYRLPNAGDYNIRTHDDRSPKTIKAQGKKIEEALKSGKEVKFRTTQGKLVKLRVKKTAVGYDYKINGHEVKVTFDKSFDQLGLNDIGGTPVDAVKQRYLAKAVDLHGQLPKIARDGFKQLNFVKPVPPKGDNIDVAAFKRSTKTMTIYGAHRLTEANFDHEAGHGLGYKMSNNLEPKGYAQAVEKDKNEIAGYPKDYHAEKSKETGPWARFTRAVGLSPGLRSEDFAETFAAYAEARESGPAAMKAFQKKFPNRAHFMAPYFGDRAWRN